jgi:hypothetical protein
VKEMRDKAYAFMKLAVDEIRATGQYAFWRDEDRKKGYVSCTIKSDQNAKTIQPNREIVNFILQELSFNSECNKILRKL